MARTDGKTTDFDRGAESYDRWYDEHRPVYLSELRAVRAALPRRGRGLEIGVGTGRFASALGIKTGVEPSAAMAALARGRGIEVRRARAGKLPFPDNAFAFALIAAALCFVRRPAAALKEARRVIRPGGRLALAIMDRDSPAGMEYWRKRSGRPFYRGARPLGAAGAAALLKELGFGRIRAFQTLFSQPEAVKKPEPARPGSGEGIFVVFSAVKAERRPPGAGGGTKRRLK